MELLGRSSSGMSDDVWNPCLACFVEKFRRRYQEVMVDAYG